MAITLKAARVNAGYTIEQAAELIGISVPTLRNYENYKRYPKVNLIPRIYKVYKMPEGDIIFSQE